MSGNIIQLNEQFIHNELKTIVKNKVIVPDITKDHSLHNTSW